MGKKLKVGSSDLMFKVHNCDLIYDPKNKPQAKN